MDKELHEFLQSNGFEQDKTRPRMGNVITPRIYILLNNRVKRIVC